MFGIELLVPVVFAKGCEFLLVSLGEGFEVRFRWVGWGVFQWKMRERGRGWGGMGGGVGTGKGTASQCARVCRKLPFSKLSFGFSPTNGRRTAVELGGVLQ